MIDTTAEPTDVWFRTTLTLIEVAQLLDTKNPEHSSEDTWAWVIADLNGQAINITRNHTVRAARTDTRIFMDGGASSIPAELCQTMTSALVLAEIRPVYVGRWVYESDTDDFTRIVQQKFE